MKKAGKPVRPGDVAKTTGIESKEVSKIINKLKKDGKVHPPKRCYNEPIRKKALYMEQRKAKGSGKTV